MTPWLVALLVWIAAGARVGRILVRPASTVRVAILVAVGAVAGAATLAVPEVAQAVDQWLSGLTAPAEKIALTLWVGFAAAITTVAFAAWPIASRRNLRQVATVIYVLAALDVVLEWVWSLATGWVAVAAGGVFIVITGLRNLAWTPLGRGIGLFTVGTAIVTVLAVLQLLDPQRPFYAHHGWAWGLANVLLATGAVWVIVEVWVRARLLRRRIRTVHAVLTNRFPEVTAEGFKRTTTTLRASDEVTHIMDALYLQSGGGIDAFVATPPPADAEARAVAVAHWVADPVGAEPLDSRWVAPPEGMSARRWVAVIAHVYNRLDPDATRPAVTDAGGRN
ncbi:MAG TPA: hypothetical protein VIW24_12025 [Aldersonia sp.]